MKITILADQKIENTPHMLDVRKIYEKDAAQVMHLTLQPGEALKPHVTPVDVFFFILAGTPEVQVGDEKMEVYENSLVESPKNIIHCISNHSRNVARILVVKTPNPVTQTRML